MRAFIYLSQFRLKVKYRPNKNNIVPNALSQFSFDNNLISNASFSDKLNLNIYHNDVLNPSRDVHVLQKTIVIILLNFRQRVLNDYVKEKT